MAFTLLSLPTEVPSSGQEHLTADTRTQAQQTQDLLTQLAAEVAIDESWEQGGPGNPSTWLLQGHSPYLTPNRRGSAIYPLGR